MTAFSRFDSIAARYEQSLPALLLLSGLAGAVLGAATSTYQAPLEPAQVLMGSVTYDHGSAIYGMHMTMFTLVNYVLWFLLALTHSEIWSSIVLSALTGVVAMQCMAMAIFIGVRNLYTAVLASIVAALWHLYGYGIAYPILLVGSPHTNGRIGFFFPLFAILLFAFSRFRLAFFLCGISLMVHPSWGMWFGLVIFIVLVTRYRQVKPLVTRANIGAYFGGLGISVIALVLHKLTFPIPSTPSTPATDAAAKQLFYNYIRYWDYHRQRFDNPVNLARELFYAAITLVICVMIALRKKSSDGEKLFAQLMIAATLVAGVLVFVPSWFPADAFPESFIALMTGRFINSSLFLGIPLLIGFTLTRRKATAVLLVVACAWLVAYNLRGIVPLDIPHPSHELAIAIAAICFTAYDYLTQRNSHSEAESYVRTNRFLAPAALVVLILGSPYYLWRSIPEVRTNFATVRIPKGVNGKVLATSENYLLQAQARVPTITPLLDGYPYAKPNVLLEVNRELSDIYGVSLLGPPKATDLHRGEVETADYARLWEGRSCAEWEHLASQYHFGLIVAPNTLKLQLPRADNDPAWNKFFPRCESL